MFCRFLSVSDSKVTDSGVLYLCGISLNSEASGCFNLETLLARSNNITFYGIYMAVKFLSNLKYVDSQHLSKAKAMIASRVLPPETILKSISFSFISQRSDPYYVRMTHCIELKADYPPTTIDSSGHSQLLSRGAEVGTAWANLPSNQSNVVPFLATFGQHLSTITFFNSFAVDIPSITSTCRNLRSIQIDQCEFDASPAPRPTTVLPCLETLKIKNCGTLLHDQLVGLLLSPNLREIEIWNCSTFCDSVLQTAFTQHRFKSLERLTVRGCARVSKEVFASCFLSESNQLTLIRIMHCLNLGSEENRQQWLSIASARNWQLRIYIL